MLSVAAGLFNFGAGGAVGVGGCFAGVRALSRLVVIAEVVVVVSAALTVVVDEVELPIVG